MRVADIGEKIENMQKQKHRTIKVKFNADKGATMRWNFRPQQTEIKVCYLQLFNNRKWITIIIT